MISSHTTNKMTNKEIPHCRNSSKNQISKSKSLHLAHTNTLFWLGPDTFIKSGGVQLFYGPKPLLLVMDNYIIFLCPEFPSGYRYKYIF